MLPLRPQRLRTLILVVAIAPLSLGAFYAAAEPLVSETTSKVVATIAHIIIERVGGSTVDRLVGPYVDDALHTYLRNDPTLIRPALEQQQAQISQKLPDSAEKDIPILKEQLDLIQKELKALQALQQPAPSTQALAQASTHLQDGVTKMEQKLDNRDAELANVGRKLDVVATRVQQANKGEPAPTPTPEPAPLRKPSFDCRKAKTQMELLICHDARLSDIDGRLGEVYWDLHHFLSPSEAQQLKKQELAWIRDRVALLKTKCTTNDAVDMPCVIGLWKERIDQLEAQLKNAQARKL